MHKGPAGCCGQPSVFTDGRYLAAKKCVPTAIVLSDLDCHDKFPSSSSPAGLPLLELGLGVAFDVENEMIRADGIL